jgi:hypothetical protein
LAQKIPILAAALQRRLIFSPVLPLEHHRDYLVSVSTDAQDERGLSLEKKFEAPFSTRAEKKRPRVLSVEPGYDGLLESREEPRIIFSQEVTVNSCVNHISWSPSAAGVWRLEEDGRAAIFSPREPWKPLTRYRLNISTGFTGANGLALETEYSSRFVTFTDNEPPALTEAWALNPDGTVAELVRENFDGPVSENSFWESGAKLRLDFSEPVDAALLRGRLSAEPSPSLVMETEPGFWSSVVFSFAERPAYGSRLLLRLGTGVKDRAGNESLRPETIRLAVLGENSKPPALRGIRLPLAPGKSGMDQQLPRSFSPEDDVFENLAFTGDPGHFPYDQGVPFWVELYFDTAPGVSIDLFSVMDLFRVECTNNALFFSPENIRDRNFTWGTGAALWDSCYRLEVRGTLTNTTNSGVVSFRVAPGLGDSAGNRNETAFRVSLLK